MQQNSKVIILEKQHGSVSVNNYSELIVKGELYGSTNVKSNGIVIVEGQGKTAGSLNDNGAVIIRGVLGSSQTGSRKLVLEENGHVKHPKIKNGINYYEW